MMKKNSIFRSMLATLLCAMLIPFVGCKNTDEPDGPNPDTPNVPEVQYEKLNTNLASLQSIIENLGEDDLATRLAPITENETQVGYTIYFLQNAPVNIYTGLDGKIPAISVNEEGGQYYWTINGDAQGNKYAVKDVLPQTQTVDEQWQISWDEGKKWENVTVSSDSKINVSQNEDWILVSFNGETVTLPKNAALGCTFDVVFSETTSSSVKVNITPSESDVYYYWGVYTKNETEEYIREYLQGEIDYYSGFNYTASEYWKMAGTCGETDETVYNLAPNTEHKILVVAIDMTTGKYASEFNWFEFTTKERNPEELASISIACQAYFSGEDMAREGGSGFNYYAKNDLGYASFVVTTQGAPVNYYWALSEWDKETFESLTDEQIAGTLVYSQAGVKKNTPVGEYVIKWDTHYALIGVAENPDGSYCYPFRASVVFDKSKCSDIHLLFPKRDNEGETSAAPKYALPKLDKEYMQPISWVK